MPTAPVKFESENQAIATCTRAGDVHLSAREQCGAWLLGLIETPLICAITIWLLTLPALFAAYHPLLRPASQTADAEAVVRWLGTSYRGRSLNLAVKQGQFGPQELRHYSDVRRVFARLPQAIAVLALSWMVALLLAKPSRQMLAAAQGRGLLWWAGLAVLLGGLALLDWPRFFALVHQPFFGSRSWRLPDDCYSLQLFPASFWRVLASAVLLSPAAAMGIAWLALRGRRH